MNEFKNRHKNLGHAIEIDLNQYGYKDYSVMCIYKYDKPSEKYLLTMFLRNSQIDDLFSISGQLIDTQPISGTYDTIRSNVCHVVSQMVYHNFFDKFIERYEYTYKCCDMGAEMMDVGTNEPEDVERKVS